MMHMAVESLYHDYIAGALGGSIGYAFGYPFDTTKVQLQTQQHGNRYKGFTDAFRHIYRERWVCGFYRGMSWPLVTVGITNSVFFGVFGNTLKYLEPDRETRKTAYGTILLAACMGGAAQTVLVIPIDYIKVVLQSQIQHQVKGSKGNTLKYLEPDRETRKTAYGTILLAACMGGEAQTVLVIPIDYIKVVLQSQIQHQVKGSKGVAVVGPAMFRGPLECASYICRTEGPLRLYKGAGITLCRDVPCFGVYGLTYMYLSCLMKSRGWSDSRGLIADLLGGGVAGMAAWLSVMPVDVVKSRYQADMRGQFRGYLDCVVRSYRDEGLRVFFRGSMAICLRSVAMNAVEFMIYAQVLRYLQSSDKYSEL